MRGVSLIRRKLGRAPVRECAGKPAVCARQECRYDKRQRMRSYSEVKDMKETRQFSVNLQFSIGKACYKD